MEFQRRDVPLETGTKSEPLPHAQRAALPVYLVLITPDTWCYYGYQYNETHLPRSNYCTDRLFSVLIVLSLILMGFQTTPPRENGPPAQRTGAPAAGRFSWSSRDPLRRSSTPEKTGSESSVSGKAANMKRPPPVWMPFSAFDGNHWPSAGTA